MCKRASGKITRHQALNDVIARAFVAADMPVTKEPNGLSISDNKRPDGLTLLPWQEGKPLAWDVTVISVLWLYRMSLAILPVHLLNWPPPESVKSMLICPTPTFSSPWHLKIWALLTRQPLLSFLHLGARSAPSLMIFVNPLFSTSAWL